MSTLATKSAFLLLQRATNGDSRAFEAFFLAFQPKVFQYVERHLPNELRDAFEPEDIIQDVFFEAARRLSQFAPEGKDAVQRWLYTIARNRLTSLLRMHRAMKRAGQRQTFSEIASDDSTVQNLLEQWAVYERTPSQSVAAHEVIEILERSIKQLPEHYQRTIRLRHVDGLTVEQTAVKLERTVGAAQMLYQRAIRAMRMILESESRYM